MTATGYVLEVDYGLRVRLPRKICNAANICHGCKVEAFLSGDNIVLSRYGILTDMADTEADARIVVQELYVESENLKIQLRSLRQIAEAFREDARVHREECEELRRELDHVRRMAKIAAEGCVCCRHQGDMMMITNGICGNCRRFTGIGEDLWEV